MFPNNDLPVHPHTRADHPNGDRTAALHLSTPTPDDPPISPFPTPQLAKTNYIFVDLENVQPHIPFPDGRLVKLKIFVGPKQGKVPLEMVLAIQAYGPNAEHIQTDGQADNALDFYITYYIGEIVGSMGGQIADVCFHIISKDRGFDPLIKHLKAKGIFCHRARSFSEVPFDGIFPTGVAIREPSLNNKPRSKQQPNTKNAAAPTQSNSKTPDRIQVAVKRLSKFNGKPGTLKTLKGTIRSWFPKTVTETEIDEVVRGLIELGRVKVSQDKLTYGSDADPQKPKTAVAARSSTLPSSTPAPTAKQPLLNPADPVECAEAYRAFLFAKLKCEIPSLDIRELVYEELESTLQCIARDQVPTSLDDLSAHIAHAIATKCPGLPQTTVFKLLLSLYRMRAFEAVPSNKPFNPTVFASNRGDASWDGYFILNCVQLMARERSEWPVNDYALADLFGVSLDEIRRTPSLA